jgi:hypothetical protein
MRTQGTDDGAPSYTSDHTAPYLWWEGTDAQKEIQPIATKLDSDNVPSHWVDSGTCNDGTIHYPSHDAVDRHGILSAMADTECYYPIRFSIWDNDNAVEMASVQTDINYAAWSGFSDYAVGITNSGDVKILSWVGDSTYAFVGDVHSGGLGDFVQPSQSPDGTKVGLRSDWLNPSSGQSDAYIVTAYYPYPPLIKSTTTTGGVITVEVHWDLGGTPRGYSTRGWPTLTDDAPPPREIKEFRLWRSTDKSTWTPVKTFAYNIWDIYDFADGTWNSGNEASNTWSTTESITDGTYYYAVTSIEHSGLESRTLSNIYSITISNGSGAGSQDTAYPASPGADANITSDYDSDLHRYYNIYAADGSIPTISQTNRIASDARTTKSYVDWLGNTSGTTQYVVTAVDTQGNESTAIDSTFTHKQSPATADGQYTINWDDAGLKWTGNGTVQWSGSGTITWE